MVKGERRTVFNKIWKIRSTKLNQNSNIKNQNDNAKFKMGKYEARNPKQNHKLSGKQGMVR